MRRSILLAALLAGCASKPAVDDGLSESSYISDKGVYAQAKPRGLSAEEAATDKNVIGCVKVEYLIRPDGSATEVRILQSVPAGYFDARVLRAMEQMRFQPRSAMAFGERIFSFGPNQSREVLDSAAALCKEKALAPLPPPPEGGFTGADAPAPCIGCERPSANKPQSTTPRRPTGRH